MQGVSIGEAARQSGVKIPTIRYYEQIGLLTAPPRSTANRRCYHTNDLKRLAFIRHSRELGFEIDEIRTLLTLQDEPDQSCQAANTIAKAHLANVVERIGRLENLRNELERMVACRHNSINECRVIEVLSDHGLCCSVSH